MSANQNKKELQLLQERMDYINKLVEEKHQEIVALVVDFQEDTTGSVRYSIGFSTDAKMGFFHKKTIYLLNKDKKLRRYDDRKSITKKDKELAFKVHNLVQIRMVQGQIKNHIKELCEKNKLEWQEEGITFYLVMTRVGKPKHLLSREDIKKALLARKDEINQTLAIDTEGYLHLIPTDTIETAYYAVRLEEDEYESFRFTADNIEDLYLTLLNGWKEHLEQECSKWVFVKKNKLGEEKLLMEISKLSDKI